MIVRHLLLGLLALFLTLSVQAAPPVDDLQVRIEYKGEAQLIQLQRAGLDIVRVDDNYAEIITNPATADSLAQLGFATTTVHESVSTFYRSRLAEKDMGGYMTLAEIEAYMDGLAADHPGIVSVKESIGLTLEGRDMYAFKISDNPSVDEDEPEVLFTAAIHAREVITPLVLFHFVDHLTDNYDTDPDLQALVDDREIWIIPVCNPDGYYYNEVTNPSGGGMWRKNRRDNGDGTFGVDLNRNFGYRWGYDDNGSSPDPSSFGFRGTAPFSEPETQNLRDFTIGHEFVISNYYHSYSNLGLFPWGYERMHTPDRDIYTVLGDSIQSMNGYECGPVSIILYPVNGGSIDWEYGEQTAKPKIYATSFEVGNSADGFWPAVARIPELVAENLEPLLFLTRTAGHIEKYKAPAAPVAEVANTVNGEEFTVSWTHDDPNSPAVAFELTEYQQGSKITDPADLYDHWDADGFLLLAGDYYSYPRSFISRYSLSGDSEHYLQAIHPFQVREGDTLRFQAKYQMESFYEYVYVEVSTDGVNFNPIPGNILARQNPYGINRGFGIAGVSDGWVPATFDLSGYVGQTILVRFAHESGSGSINETFQFDDFWPVIAFDNETLLGSDLTENSLTLTDRPMGTYNYRVRARDAEGQWSNFSPVLATSVLRDGTGDMDLDGIDASIADLALFNLYFGLGLSAFEFFPDTQIGQSDFDCDGLTLTGADLTTLSGLLLGSQAPCYEENPGPSRGDGSTTLSAALAEENGWAVEIRTTSFDTDDSAWVDIVLTEADLGYLGFQFHIQYETAALVAPEVRFGAALSNWQQLEYNAGVAGEMTDLRLLGTAWTGGDPLVETDIAPETLPVVLVRLKASYAVPHQDLTLPINFAWDGCGDNSLALGRLEDSRPELDSLALAHQVFNADGDDITGVDPLYGGPGAGCGGGLFGGPPVATIDFRSAELVYDPPCCIGLVGDVNGQGGDIPTIGDVAYLINYLFLAGTGPDCLAEADVNQSGGPLPAPADLTIGDVSYLIDYLFITGSSLGLPSCL